MTLLGDASLTEPEIMSFSGHVTPESEQPSSGALIH